MHIYVDESGDLGWKFDAPYRAGGSSRHLTIASLCVDPRKKHLPKRIVQRLYKKFNWKTSREKKWSEMSDSARQYFAEEAAKLQASNRGLVKYLSITVKKENVLPHIRRDPNKLYNYMMGISLVREMAKHDEVLLLPDDRSMKVGSGNSLDDYLQTQLWFDRGVETVLTTKPCDSSAYRNVQFADMLSGVVQGHFEDGNSDTWHQLRSSISYKTLFF